MRSPLVALLAAASVASAEDIETLKHEVYKNATVSRVEPDGIVITHAAGIVKIPFAELSEDYKKRFSYDEAAAKKFADDDATKQRQLYDRIQQQNAQAAEKQRRIEEEREVAKKLENAKKELAAAKEKTEQIRRDAIANHLPL